MSKPVIYSIGYQYHTPESLFARLEREGVTCLVDVRDVPASRKKGFSKKALAEESEKRGIRYVHMKALGNPKEIRENLKRNGDYRRAFEKYSSFLKKSSQGLDELQKLMGEYKCCLICLEHSHTICHRKVILNELSTRQKKIKVILLE